MPDAVTTFSLGHTEFKPEFLTGNAKGYVAGPLDFAVWYRGSADTAAAKQNATTIGRMILENLRPNQAATASPGLVSRLASHLGMKQERLQPDAVLMDRPDFAPRMAKQVWSVEEVGLSGSLLTNNESGRIGFTPAAGSSFDRNDRFTIIAFAPTSPRAEANTFILRLAAMTALEETLGAQGIYSFGVPDSVNGYDFSYKPPSWLANVRGSLGLTPKPKGELPPIPGLSPRSAGEAALQA